MSLLDQITALEASRPLGRPCGAGVVLSAMPDDQAAEVEEALRRWPRIRWETVATFLREMGHDVNAGALSRHARGECKRCPRPFPQTN